MIYVDVTSACLLPLQSGIPRTTRGIFQKLEESGESVVPILWQPFFHGYTRPSPRGLKLLRDPFSLSRAGEVPPKDWTVPLLWASLKEAFAGNRRLSLSSLLGEEDVFLVTSLFPDNRLIYLKKILQGRGRKLVLFHDALPLVDPNVPALAKPFHRCLLELLAGFDRVLCVSHFSEQELKRLWVLHGISAAPTAVLPWPVPFSGSRPAFQISRAEPKRLLYVARLKKIKNHQVLLQACRILWEKGYSFRLELIGCEDVPYESREILQSVRSLQEKGFAVVWRGHVREEELQEAYQACSFTVFPSLMEGFGLPIIESFWHGRPVVCGVEGAVEEVSRGPGIVPVGIMNAEELAGAMQSLLEKPELGEELSRAAYDRPVRTWADYGRELEAALR
jgi:glycosyltransferase involved in cell wall biosynthesis